MLPHVEKSAFRPGWWIGYGKDGSLWQLRRTGVVWTLVELGGQRRYMHAKTLEEADRLLGRLSATATLSAT